mgnify:FL=1
MNVTFKKYEDIYGQAKRIYQEHEEKILKALPFVDIQHIGSTAIPNSVTKGDLDINVRISREHLDYAIEELKKFYEINQPENWTSTFASFKNDNNFDLPVGVQLTVIDSEYDDFTKLRDILLKDKKLLEEYNQMKLKYEGKDMDDYRKEKSEFFEKLRKLLK